MRCSACGGLPAAAPCGRCHAAAPPGPAPAGAAAPAAVAVAAPAPPWLADPPARPAPPAVDLADAPRRHRAGWTTAGAIAVVAVTTDGLGRLADSGAHEVEALVRYAFVALLAAYGVVGYLVLNRIQADGRPLRWLGWWRLGPSVAFGAVVGGAFGAVILALARAQGSPAGDESAALLVSEGSVPHVVTAFVIVCVAAPVVEELLFRGLLLASWDSRGRRLALWGSALAFGFWHLDVRGLAYYTLAGVLLGALYLRHGLASSMAAHAAFNGALLVAAVAYALAPGAVLTGGGVTLQAPDGWHAVDASAIEGPSGATVEASVVRYDGATATELADRVRAGRLPEIGAADLDVATARTVDLPAGAAVRFDVSVSGYDGEVVLIPAGERLHLVVLRSGGSRRARDDFDAMLETLRLTRASPPGGG